MKWNKIQKLFDPTVSGNDTWMCEQAQNPFALVKDDAIRITFNTRGYRDSDGNSISRPGYIEVSLTDLTDVIAVGENPVLDTGSPGTFDEHGVMTGGSIIKDGTIYLYYVGWSRKVGVPYDWKIGLATSVDNGRSFTKIGRGPVLGPTHTEPYLQAGCSCILEHEGLFHLYYTSGTDWLPGEKKMESVYQIMHATSVDLIHWKRDGVPIISEVVENEAQASPTVVYKDGKWHMLFSYRHSVNFRNKERGYRIGYASSVDLLNWKRNDEQAGLSVSDQGWDSEMVCYPHMFVHQDQIYLLYCGNDFGREGFGIASLVD